MAVQWHEREPALLDLEKIAVRECFPLFAFHRCPDATMALKGAMRSRSGRVYTVAVVYPPDYPQTAPRVYPLPRLSGPHEYSDGAMCLYRPDDRVWTSDSTAVTVLALAARWLHAHEVWERTGHWPGRQH